MHTKVVSYSQVSLDKKLLPSDTLEIECLHRTRCGDCLRPIRRCFHGYFVEEVWLAFFVAGRVATEFESAAMHRRRDFNVFIKEKKISDRNDSTNTELLRCRMS